MDREGELHFERFNGVLEVSRDLLREVLLLTDFRVIGRDNLEIVRQLGPSVFAFFPHTGHLDSWALRNALPFDLKERLVVGAAQSYWFPDHFSLKPLMANLALQVEPISREGAHSIDKGMNSFVGFLEKGYSVALSPEGTRSLKLPEKRALKPGVADLALRAGVPIVPVIIRGLEGAWPKGTPMLEVPRRFLSLVGKPVTVMIGKPIHVEVVEELADRRILRKQITRGLREVLLDMNERL